MGCIPSSSDRRRSNFASTCSSGFFPFTPYTVTPRTMSGSRRRSTSPAPSPTETENTPSTFSDRRPPRRRRNEQQQLRGRRRRRRRRRRRQQRQFDERDNDDIRDADATRPH